MRLVVSILLVFTLTLSFSTGDARNTIHQFPIDSALERGAKENVLIDSVQMFFGEQAHPAVAENKGEYTSNRKTNAFGKSDEKACEWAFLSAVKTLQERAVSEGGNAVINIYSFYYKNKFVSDTQYECGAGATVAGVTLVGEVVTLAD